MTNSVDWSDEIWKEIDAAVLVEMGKVRTGQKVFPTAHFDDNPTQVPDELIDFRDLSIQEGQTKPFVEISATFTLTSTQVRQEYCQKTGLTLARMAAKALALGEDIYFFQSSHPGPRGPESPPLPSNVRVDNWRLAVDLGLLREANPDDADNGDPTRVAQPLTVNRVGGENPNNAQWGNNTFARVAQAITLLVGKAQAPPYALLLPTEAYADAFIPPSPDSLVTTADRVRPLVEGGFYTSPVLPRYEGLFVALAGDPVHLHVGREVATEFVVQQSNEFLFRVVERVQYVVRDPRSLILLRFEHPAQGDPAAG